MDSVEPEVPVALKMLKQQECDEGPTMEELLGTERLGLAGP